MHIEILVTSRKMTCDKGKYGGGGIFLFNEIV